MNLQSELVSGSQQYSVGSIQRKSSSGQTILPLQGSWPHRSCDSSSPAGQSSWLSHLYLQCKGYYVTPLVSPYEPRGDAVLILPLALVLPRLTSSPPWFNQNLQDLLDLIRPVMISGCSLVPGPALVVPSICLYHGGDHQGGGGVPPCLLKSTKQQQFFISQRHGFHLFWGSTKWLGRYQLSLTSPCSSPGEATMQVRFRVAPSVSFSVPGRSSGEEGWLKTSSRRGLFDPPPSLPWAAASN